jgi:lambda repressor-like predicted transcriptional regulator
MLPAADLSEILTNLSALNLQPNTAAQILAAVLAPLLRADPAPLVLPRKRIASTRVRPRRAAQRKKPKHRAAATPVAQNKHSGRDAPRQRAVAALKANPGVSLTRVAKVAGVSRSTVVNAARELAAEARKQARREARQASTTPKPAAKPLTEARVRAQRFLRDTLAHGPKPVTAVEEAAEKAHIETHVLAQARAELGVVTTRGNAGGVQAVQWSLPG